MTKEVYSPCPLDISGYSFGPDDRMKITRSDWKQNSPIVRIRRERHDGGVTRRM